jgi:hypothetical protein
MMNRSKIRVSILSRLGFALLVCLALGACASSPPADDADNLTLGQVQSRITKGMGAAEVAEALGSPNIVTTDAEGREVWIYDKISTESQASESGFWGGLILFGGSRSRSRRDQVRREQAGARL